MSPHQRLGMASAVGGWASPERPRRDLGGSRRRPAPLRPVCTPSRLSVPVVSERAPRPLIP